MLVATESSVVAASVVAIGPVVPLAPVSAPPSVGAPVALALPGPDPEVVNGAPVASVPADEPIDAPIVWVTPL